MIATGHEFCGRGRLLSCNAAPREVLYFFLTVTRSRSAAHKLPAPAAEAACAAWGHLTLLEDVAGDAGRYADPKPALYTDDEHRLLLADGTELLVSLQHYSRQPLTIYRFAATALPPRLAAQVG
jgi:hypothetical protein